MSFAAGAASLTVTVEPTAESEIEPDKTVALTLATGTGYSIVSTATGVGAILNDNTANTNQGNTKLLSRGNGKAFVEYGAGTRQVITSPWNASGATTPPASSTPRASIPTGTGNPPVAPTVSTHPRPGF